MTESSFWWTTNGSPTGHQVVSYSQAALSDIVNTMMKAKGPNGIAAFDTAGIMNASVPTANTLRVGAGSAVVDGKPYKNTSNVDVNFPNAASGYVRIDRVVLRASWASYTVALTRIAGTEVTSSPVPATITTTPGTTYDILLYQVWVNSSGISTVTDERQWSGGEIPVTRYGGSATNWTIYGTNLYTLTEPPSVQLGVTRSTYLSPGATVLVPIDFEPAFEDPPILIMTPFCPATDAKPIAWLVSIGAGTAFVYVQNNSATSQYIDIQYVVYGSRKLDGFQVYP